MARITGKLRDRNRFTKKYPFIRAPKREVLESTGTIVLEFLSLNFQNSDTASGNYEVPFSDTDFRVLLSPRDTTNEDSANVVVSLVAAGSNTETVTVQAPAPFIGVVDVIAIKVVES